MIMLLSQAGQAAATGQGNESYILWGMGLLGVAFVLLLLEAFVPSGGLIGALCCIAAVGSIASFFKYDTMWGIVAGLLYIVLTPILIYFIFKMWLHSPMAKLMILTNDDDTMLEGVEDTMMASEIARHKRMAELQELIGLRGITITSLRPVGKVRIEGRRVDAMAETGIIESDTPIVVVDVYDNQIKVRPE